MQVLLTERGLPLRGATITAKITGPSTAIGHPGRPGHRHPG